MVNKTDFSGSNPPPGIDLFLQELIAKYPMQLSAALAQLGQTDLSLPSKLAQQFLPKEPLESGTKLDRLITLLPSLGKLSPEATQLIEAAKKLEQSSDHSPDRSKGDPKEAQLKSSSGNSASAKKDVEKMSSEKTGIDFSAKKEQFIPRGGGGEKAAEPLSSPTTIHTIKQVLSILSYVAHNIEKFKPEPMEALEKLIKPLLDQLVKPPEKPSEGELQSQNREIPKEEKGEKAASKEKSLPLPPSSQQKAEKPLHEHTANRLDRDPKAPILSDPRPQEPFSKKPAQLPTPSNVKNEEAVAKPMPIPSPPDRIAIPAAPFSFQHPISTAPRRFKKKPKDAWEEEEERLKDEEDPFNPK